MGQKIQIVFVLSVLCIFAGSVLMTLMLGANVYVSSAAVSEEVHGGNVCLSYIWTKIKNNDNANSISVEDFNGTSALCFTEIFGDREYITRIYFHDGWVYELFSEKGVNLLPEDGLAVMEAKDLSFELTDDGLLKVSSDSKSLILYLRSLTAA